MQVFCALGNWISPRRVYYLRQLQAAGTSTTHSLACSGAAEVSCCKLQLWGRSCVGWVNIDAWVAWLTVVPAVDWVNQATQSSLFLLQLSGCSMNFDATQAPFVELVKALVEQVQSEH